MRKSTRRVKQHFHANGAKTQPRKRRIRTVERLEDRHLLAATPIGYWTFDDAGNLGADTTDNANDLASFGGASFSAGGVTGGALALDGTGYLGGIDPTGLPAGNDHYSIAAWIKPTTTGKKGIVGWGDFGGILRETTLGLVETNGLRHDWGLVNLTANSSIVTAAGVDLDDGQWHHVAATADGEERALWLDGEKLVSGPAPLHSVENRNFRIGSSCVGCADQQFAGLLDDVVIYNVGLDANQVASLYNGTSPLELRDAGLIAQWAADDLTTALNDGDAVATWTENVLGAPATANGTVRLETGELNGHAVVRFNPSDGNDQLRITAADNPLSGVVDYSVAIVFRAASAGVGDDTGWEDNTGLIDASQLGTTNDWGLGLTREGQVGGGIGGPDVTAYSPSGANFANGQPHVAVFTRSGGTTSLYVDDFSPISRSDAGTSLRGAFDVTIGSLQTNENYFNGDIAEIQLYNKSLAGDEAVALAGQLVTKYGIESPDVPVRIAGELLVDLRATHPSAGEAIWRNGGTLGDFSRIGNPFTEVIAGVTAVSFNSDNPVFGWDDAYAGPLAPANITGDGLRSIEVWAYNPADGTQNDEETAVAWGRRGGPAGSNLTFGYGSNGTWGAVGHWGTPDMPWFPGGGSPALGQWHHLVYTYDGSTARVYADGELANSEAVGILSTHPNTTINLAAQNGGSGTLSLTEGQAGSLSLANVRVHSGVLSDSDIVANFAAGIQVAGDPPDTQPDSYAATEDQPLSIDADNGVLSNDTDPNMLTLSAILEEPPANGALVLGIDGSFTYTPNADFNGTDAFSYRASNGDVFSDVVNVTLNVQPRYDAAVAVPDNYVIDVNQLFSVDASRGILANDMNVDLLPLSTQLVADSTAGQLALNGDGSFSYDPQGVRGPQTFSYRIDDSVGQSNVVIVTFVVDTPPAARADSYTLDEDRQLTISAANGVLDNDTDAETDPLTAILVTDVQHGDLTLRADGSFVYQPAADFFGSDSFQYHANDGDQDSVNVNVTLTVNPLNDAPLAVDDTFFGFEGQLLVRGPVQGVLANDIDVDGPSLSAVLVDGPADGDLTLNADGSFSYTPPAEFLGTQTFTYKVTDSLVESSTATATLLINSLDQQIVINEINYDPPDNTVPTQFIELYNAGASPVALSNWFFSDGISFTFPSGVVMQPETYLVIAADPETLAAEFGVTALGPWDGALSNDGEEIVLRNALADVVDRVDYSVAFPWPAAAAGDGGSMELIHPTLDNDLGGSWRTSQVDNSNALIPTPGQRNSVFAVNAPPQSRQAGHSPNEPTSGDDVVITLKVTDPDGVANVNLQYQVVLPGQYIPAFLPVPISTLLQNADTPPEPNPAYFDPVNWTTVAMADNGAGADGRAGDGTYTATIPAQGHRTLVRYRMTVEDSLARRCKSLTRTIPR